MFLQKSDHNVSKSQSKLKRYQYAMKRRDECSEFRNKIQNQCCMNVLGKYTSYNIFNVNNVNVVDNTTLELQKLCHLPPLSHILILN